MSASDYRNPSWSLRVGLGVDDLGQAITNRGLPGMSISARAGTARHDYYEGTHEKHHLWGVWLAWLLDKAVLRFTWKGKCYLKIGFGPDPVTGQSHCDGAIDGDSWRSFDVIVALWKYRRDPELIVAMRALIDSQEAPLWAYTARDPARLL